MSNRSPKILWPIDYSSMTSTTHWCNWLLIDCYTAHERNFSCFLVPFFSFVILLSVLEMQFSLYLMFLLMMSRRKVLITKADDSIVQFENWTTLLGQPSRCGLTKTAKKILEKLPKLNFHVLLELKRMNLETTVYIYVVLILFCFAKYVCSYEMISKSNGWNQWLINAIND